MFNRFHWIPRSLTSPFSKITALIILCYIGLNAFYLSMGYLTNLDNRIRGVDGVFYFVYLPSILFDQDVQFENNLTAIYGENYAVNVSDNGAATNTWAIGPAMLWLPFYILAHGLTLCLNAFFGMNLPSQGYGGLYYASVYIANTLYGGMSVLICARLLLNYFSPIASAVSACAMLFATQLTYYICAFTATSHCPSLFITALFFYVWLNKKIHPLTAVVAGLMIATRWQNALYVLPLALESLIIGWQRIKAGRPLEWLKANVLFIGIILVIFLPQALTWEVIYDSPFVIPQGNDFLNFSDLPIFKVLFHSNHGLFLWHPILLLGFFGVFILYKRHASLAISLVVIFGLQLILNASVSDWNAAWSFGHRRFMATLPVFIIGLAALLDAIRPKLRYAFYGLIVGLSIWNQLFIFQFLNDLIPHSSALTYREFVVDKFQLPRVYRAHELSRKAYISLQMNQLDAFKSYATEGYALSPRSYKVFITYALKSLFFDDLDKKYAVFSDWYRQTPDVLVAKWGLAQCLIAMNNSSAALDLFSPTSLTPGSMDERVYNAITSGETMIINETYVQEFHTHIYTTYML